MQNTHIPSFELEQRRRRIQPRHIAWIISLLLHGIALLLLLYAIKDELTTPRIHQAADSRQDAAQQQTQVIFAPEADETTVPQQQAVQAAPQQVQEQSHQEEIQQEQRVEQEIEQLQEAVAYEEPPVISHMPTQERRARSRNAWKKTPEETTQQQKTTIAHAIQGATRYEVPVHEPYAMSDQELGKKATAAFTNDALGAYMYSIMRAIIYEVNKRKILYRPSEVPPQSILIISITNDGTLIHVELNNNNPHNPMNEKIIEAVHAAAPFRKAPRQLQHIFKNGRSDIPFWLTNKVNKYEAQSSRLSPLVIILERHPSAQANY